MMRTAVGWQYLCMESPFVGGDLSTSKIRARENGPRWRCGAPHEEGAPADFTFDNTGLSLFPGGQGRVLGCDIHNNGGHGIGIQLDGWGVGNFRLIRSTLWNNQGSGWDAQMDGFTFSGMDFVSQMACPILFSTLAGNVGPSANIDVTLGFTPDFSLPVVLGLPTIPRRSAEGGTRPGVGPSCAGEGDASVPDRQGQDVGIQQSGT